MSETPLTPEQLQIVTLAGERAQKIQRTARIAAFNGWTMGVFAIVSLLLALGSFSFVGMLITLGLGVVAYNEFRGRRLIRRFDPRAGSLLGWNQVGLIAVIVIYCVWKIGHAYLVPEAFDRQIDEAVAEVGTYLPEARSQAAELKAIIRPYYLPLVAVVYGSVIALIVLFQGANAWYYFARGNLLKKHLAETPPEVLEFHRSVSSR